MVVKLPPELISLTLGFLRNDKRTLVTTARVCRAWHTPSQYALVHYIYVVPSDIHEYPDREQELTPRSDQDDVNPPRIQSHTLVELITKYPILGNYVKVLTVKTILTLDETFYANIISLLPSRLPGLTRLVLEGSDNQIACADFLEGVVSAVRGHPHLTYMELDMNFIRPDLLTLFAGTNIERLTIVEDDVPSEMPDTRLLSQWEPVPLPTEILHLSLSAKTLAPFWTVIRAAMPNLRRLGIISVTPVEVSMLNTILATPDAIPPSVKAFVHVVNASQGEGRFRPGFPPLDFRNVSVEHIGLSYEITEGVEGCIRWWKDAFDLLPTSHPVKRVTLAFEPLVTDDHTLLDAAIARLDVREVYFVKPTSNARPFLEISLLTDVILAVYPQLARKGVLRLC